MELVALVAEAGFFAILAPGPWDVRRSPISTQSEIHIHRIGTCRMPEGDAEADVDVGYAASHFQKKEQFNVRSRHSLPSWV